MFGVYAVALLLALLTVGGLSDFVGRRPVLVGALGLLTASMIVFANADGLALALRRAHHAGPGRRRVDRHAERGHRLARPARTGAAGRPAQRADPQPRARPRRARRRRVRRVRAEPDRAGVRGRRRRARGAGRPDSASPTSEQERRDGALTSLVPRVRVAAPVRGAFLRATPSLFAPWAQMGLTLSLLVSLAAAQFGISNHFESGLIVVTVCLAGTVSGFLLRDTSPVQSNRFGAVGLIVGIGVTLAGLHADSLAVFVARLGARRSRPGRLDERIDPHPVGAARSGRARRVLRRGLHRRLPRVLGARRARRLRGGALRAAATSPTSTAPAWCCSRSPCSRCRAPVGRVRAARARELG